MKYDFITIGTLVQDIFLVERDTATNGSGQQDPFCFVPGSKNEFHQLYTDIGGEAANVAVATAQLGYKSAIVAKVGTDDTGKQLLAALRKKKVGVSMVSKDTQQKTGYGIMMVDSSGRKTALVHRGAGRMLQISDIPLMKINCRWLHLSSVAGKTDLLEQTVNRVEKKNMRISFNPGVLELEHGLKALASLLRKVDVLILNREEAQLLVGHQGAEIPDLFRTITLATPGIVAITDGNKGAYVTAGVDHESGIYFAPPSDKVTIEETGAGDAFAAGLIAGLFQDYDNIERALQLAIVTAASATTDYGAQRGLLKRFPSKIELERIRVTTL